MPRIVTASRWRATSRACARWWTSSAAGGEPISGGLLDPSIPRVYAPGTGVSGDEGLIPMQVSALAVDPVTNVPVVILVDPVAGTSLPVGIGLGEAPAIAAELDGIELERPMTHQLTAALL